MSTQKRKFELFARLQALGFTYEEAVSLRRIEMTLQRWGELECGDSNDYASRGIERDDETGRPYMVIRPNAPMSKMSRYPVADREAGALKRLASIVKCRNLREADGLNSKGFKCEAVAPFMVIPYHQGDCRGCNLYLLTRKQLTDRQTGETLPVEQYYTRGLAVCA